MTFGLEWGYIATINTTYHYNFFSDEGYRVDSKDCLFRYFNNADMYAYLGYDLSDRWNLALYMGLAGMGGYHKAIPVSLRMTRYFEKNNEGDRWFSFLDLGSGIDLKIPVQEIVTGKIGGGYSLALSKRSSLNFILTARVVYTHPRIIYEQTIIPMEKTNRNDAFVSALSLGLSISF